MNFDNTTNRLGTFCTQWDYIEDRFGEGTKNLVPFTISDMDFQSPKEIIEALHKRIDHGVFGYTRWNNKEYKEAIVNWYKKYNSNVNSDWIVYSPSVIYSISLILEKVVNEKKKVATHTPYYDGFTKLFEIYNPIYIPLKENSEDKRYYTDFWATEEAFKNGVSAFLLCNPQNPTGKLWTKDELTILVELAKKYNVYLISDEIHMDILRGEFVSLIDFDYDKIVVVNSPSKTFNIPGLGGSYAIIKNDLLKEKFLYHTKNIDGVSSGSIFGILATIEAYNNCSYWVRDLNKYIKENMKFVKENLDNFKGLKVSIPEATYLMWIDIKNCEISPKELQNRLITISKIAIMPGDNYGDPYKLRLNVGCPLSKVKIAVEGIKKALTHE